MKNKLLITLLVLSLLGNVALGIHAQRLANKLGDAYNALESWVEFYETLPKGITIEP